MDLSANNQVYSWTHVSNVFITEPSKKCIKPNTEMLFQRLACLKQIAKIIGLILSVLAHSC